MDWAGVCLVIAWARLWSPSQAIPIRLVIAEGLVVGAATGLVGAGGGVLGAMLVDLVPAEALRKIFAALVLTTASYIVWREAALWPALSLVLTLVSAFTVYHSLRRQKESPIA